MKDSDAKTAFYKRELKEHENSLGSYYSYVSEGKTMFYAGGYVYEKDGKEITNWHRAEDYAAAHKMNPIEKTQAGDYLTQNKDRLNHHFGKWDMRNVWNCASRTYASQAKGTIRTFVAGADERSIFRTTELPVILNNRKVKDINGIDRSELRDYRKKEFENLRAQGVPRREAAVQATAKAHNKVANAELQLDKRKAEQTKDTALMNDVNARQKNLDAQNKIEAQDKKMRQKISENQQKVMKKYSAERIEQLKERAYKQAKARGASEGAAHTAAKHRLKHVQEKMGLNAVKNKLKKEGEDLSWRKSEVYYRAVQAHRDKKVENRQRTERKHKVHQQKIRPEKNYQEKQEQAKILAKSFTRQAHLDAKKAQGRVSEKQYEQDYRGIKRTEEKSQDKLNQKFELRIRAEKQQKQDQTESRQRNPVQRFSH